MQIGPLFEPRPPDGGVPEAVSRNATAGIGVDPRVETAKKRDTLQRTAVRMGVELPVD
jgi:hypothetical protein